MRSEAPMAAKRRLDVVCNSVLFATRCCVRRVDAERSSDGSEATARFCGRLGVVYALGPKVLVKIYISNNVSQMIEDDGGGLDCGLFLPRCKA